MKLGIIISSSDAETIWNAFRFANLSLKKGDEVRVFLIGGGVEAEMLDMEKFRINAQIEAFTTNKGIIHICGTCLKLRNRQNSQICQELSTLEDLYQIVAENEKILTF